MEIKEKIKVEREEEIIKEASCDFCKEKQATITIGTPNSKDVPLCNLCFKKVNVLAGVMKGKGVMGINKIWNEVKDIDNNNWRTKDKW